MRANSQQRETNPKRPTQPRRPARAFPPGEFIREELEAREWTQGRLAEILGRPLQAVNAIVNGKKAITARTAVELAAAFGTSPELWLNLESAYRLSLAGPPDPAIASRAREAMGPEGT